MLAINIEPLTNKYVLMNDFPSILHKTVKYLYKGSIQLDNYIAHTYKVSLKEVVDELCKSAHIVENTIVFNENITINDITINKLVAMFDYGCDGLKGDRIIRKSLKIIEGNQFVFSMGVIRCQ